LGQYLLAADREKATQKTTTSFPSYSTSSCRGEFTRLFPFSLFFLPLEKYKQQKLPGNNNSNRHKTIRLQ
jgi:hypothetical protein